MTNEHRQIADDMVNRLRTKNSIEEREFRQLSSPGYDVMNWLKAYEIITQTTNGRPFTKGKRFTQYTTLDNLLNPPKETPTVIVEYKKHWYDTPLKVGAIIELIVIIVCTPIGLNMQSNATRLERERLQLSDSLLIINSKIRSQLTSLKAKDEQIEKLALRIDSLTKKLNIKK